MASVPREEKSEYDVILVKAGAGPINVIKVVHEITGLGLAESKALVQSAPKPVKEGVSLNVAKTLVIKLQDAGATAKYI